jgi:hypothetical protein
MQRLGCSSEYVAGRTVVHQQFENGLMVIFAGPGDSWGGGAIIALANDGRAWRVGDSFVDTSSNPDNWYTCERRPGQRPEQSGIPWRGFGKVWCENAELRAALGHVRTGEEVAQGTYEIHELGQVFQIGGRAYIVYVSNAGPAAAGRWQ